MLPLPTMPPIALLLPKENTVEGLSAHRKLFSGTANLRKTKLIVINTV
jgi:hypothetical protein